MSNKSYGLILPKKNDKFKPKARSIFDDDSDDDESISRAGSKPTFSLSKTEAKHKEEDPNIYEYDSIYDSMKESRSKKQSPSEAKKPRFIASILKAADKRKKDQERRVEKKIHLEREKEGDEFKDKEAFVTSAYKKKMQEMEEEEEKEKLREHLDDMMDVTKQKDLSGFYRHFLKQTTGEEKVPEFGKTEKTTSKNVRSGSSTKTGEGSKGNRYDSDSSEDDEKHRSKKLGKVNQWSKSKYSDEDSSVLTKNKTSRLKVPDNSGDTSRSHSELKSAKKQHSPERHDSESSDEEINKTLRKGKDDSDRTKRKLNTNKESYCASKVAKFSEDISPQSIKTEKKSDNEEELEPTIRQTQLETDTPEQPLSSQVDEDNIDADDDIVDSDSEKSNAGGANDEHEKSKMDTLHKISVKFVKRTVGEAFKQAQERYFKRMAAKGACKRG